MTDQDLLDDEESSPSDKKIKKPKVKKGDKLEPHINFLYSKTEKITSAVGKLDATLGRIDTFRVETTMDNFIKRLRDLEARVQLAIFKQTVLTEVSREYPRVLPVLVLAFDRPDKWWLEKKGLSIMGWFGALSGMADEKRA